MAVASSGPAPASRAVGEPRAGWLAPGDELGLIFMCCHPALALEARVALTLRCVCGLSTAQIAAGFLVPEATMARRLSRAKSQDRRLGHPAAAARAGRTAVRGWPPCSG